MSASIEFLADNIGHLLFGFPGSRPGGLVMSILLAVAGLGVGFGVAVAVGGAHDSPFSPLRRLAGAYIHLIRGIPLIVLLVLIHQVLGTGHIFALRTTPFGSAVVALVLYSSAYQADIIRTGLRAVPDNIVDWARLVGSSRWGAYRLVKLPYSLRVMQPALTGQAITLFKDTSVVVIIGVFDLTTTAHIVLGGDVANAPFWVATYLMVGALYFAVAFGASRLARAAERRYEPRGLVHSI